jgi:hypothetical protein
LNAKYVSVLVHGRHYRTNTILDAHRLNAAFVQSDA